MYRFEIHNTTSVYSHDNVSRVRVLDENYELVGTASIVYQEFNGFEWHLKDVNILVGEDYDGVLGSLMSGIFACHRYNNGDGLWTEVRSQRMKDLLLKYDWDDCEESFDDQDGQRVDIYVLLSTPFDA